MADQGVGGTEQLAAHARGGDERAHQHEHRDHAEGVVGHRAHRRLADQLQRRAGADDHAEAGDADQPHRHADRHAQQHQREQHDEAEDGDGVGAHRPTAGFTGRCLSCGMRAGRSGARCGWRSAPRRDVAEPGDREERPGRDVHVVGQHVVDVGGAHLVEQHDGLHRDDEQQHQRGEHVDHALPARAGRGPDEVDRDVAAPVAGRRDAPEDQDAEQHARRSRRSPGSRVEEIAQQHRR